MTARPAWLALCCDCGGRVDATFKPGDPAPASVVCPSCGRERTLQPGGLASSGGLLRCLACGHPELYSRKDFPRALGFTIVGVAAVLAPFTSYISLAAAAAVDGVLYWLIRDVVVCYVCGAEHRGFAPAPRHPRFDREIEERLRYGQKAVMGKPMREHGTADAPEPEH